MVSRKHKLRVGVCTLGSGKLVREGHACEKLVNGKVGDYSCSACYDDTERNVGL